VIINPPLVSAQLATKMSCLSPFIAAPGAPVRPRRDAMDHTTLSPIRIPPFIEPAFKAPGAPKVQSRKLISMGGIKRNLSGAFDAQDDEGYLTPMEENEQKECPWAPTRPSNKKGRTEYEQ